MTSSGVRKPNGAGLPILSFSTWVPRSSIRAASSTTGPRTSYNTLSSVDDFLNICMAELPALSLSFLSVIVFFIGVVPLFEEFEAPTEPEVLVVDGAFGATELFSRAVKFS